MIWTQKAHLCIYRSYCLYKVSGLSMYLLFVEGSHFASLGSPAIAEVFPEFRRLLRCPVI